MVWRLGDETVQDRGRQVSNSVAARLLQSDLVAARPGSSDWSHDRSAVMVATTLVVTNRQCHERTEATY
jgi:hypothetical protein